MQTRYSKKYKVKFWENMKNYFELLSKYKVLAFSGLVVITFIQLALVAEKFLFKEVIDNGEKFISGVMSQVDFVDSLIILLIIFAGILIVRVVGAWYRIYFINRLDSNLMRDIKTKFFNHLLNLSHNFHSENKTGSMISKIIRGSGSAERLTDVIVFSVLPLLLRFSIVAASFIYFDVKTGIALFLTTVIFIGYSVIIQQKQEKSQIMYNLSEDREKANISDVFTNIDTIKYFGKEKKIIAKYKYMTDKTYNAVIKFWDYFNWYDSGQNLILGIGTFFIFYFPLMGLINGTLTIGTLAFIYVTYTQFVGLLFQFVHGIRGFKRGLVDFNDIYQYTKYENDIKDVPGAGKIRISNGKINFRNVDFAYKKEKVIRDFNLVIPENSKVAIVGPSGSGKSTLVKLLFRLYDIEGGEILIDGQDISKFKQESLRSEMSVVPQDAILFDDTIYNNIRFSNPKATRGEVMKAIRFAQLDKLIKTLPKKEQTLVGERGVKLSGGERQRVSIARAVVADKRILVLDEATSALDSELESEIQMDLERLMKGRTSIVIAHRLSTIMKADIIIVVDKGSIVEAGTHGELLNRGSGLYKKLWGLQAGSFVSEE